MKIAAEQLLTMLFLSILHGSPFISKRNQRISCIGESQNTLCFQEAKVSLPHFPLLLRRAMCPWTRAQLRVPWGSWWWWRTHPPSVSGLCISFVWSLTAWLVFQRIVYPQKLFFICFLCFLCVPSLARAHFLLLWPQNTNPTSPCSWNSWFWSPLPLGVSPSSRLVSDSSDVAADFQPQEQSLSRQCLEGDRGDENAKLWSSGALGTQSGVTQEAANTWFCYSQLQSLLHCLVETILAGMWCKKGIFSLLP